MDVVSRRFGGVRFVVYSNDHPPRHVHGFAGETEVIIDLREDRTIALAKREDAIRPSNAKRSDVKKILRTAAERFDELAVLWGPYMLRRKVARAKTGQARIAVSKAELDRAIERTRRLGEQPLAAEVEYKPEPGLDLFILKLTDGSRRAIPREDLQGLQKGTPEQLAQIEILGGGTGLHWPALDADLYVPSLLQGIYGNRQWMAEIGRRGGLAQSTAKKKAARANGKLGGRPRSVAGD
jgi:hypothetical protein